MLKSSTQHIYSLSLLVYHLSTSLKPVVTLTAFLAYLTSRVGVSIAPIAFVNWISLGIR